jgi:Transmembrane domain of unknown function (DUF3566)
VASRPATRRDLGTSPVRITATGEDLSDWGEVAPALTRAAPSTAPIPTVPPTRTNVQPELRRDARPAGKTTKPAKAGRRNKAVTQAPVPVPKGRRRKAKPRVRRVTRVIRRVDTWSVMKVALGFYITGVVVMLVAGVLLWSVMVSTGTVDNLENFISQLFALDSFSLNGEQLLRGYAVLATVMVTALLGITVAMTVFFNLLSDVTGGIRVTVLEEEVVRVEQPRS